LVTLV